MRRKSGTLIGITLAIVATALAQQGGGDPKREILAARAAWNKAMAEHDAEAVSRMLAPDYSVVNAAYQRRGMTAERDGLAALFKARPDLLFKRTPTRVVVNDTTGNATEQGSWIERWTEKDGLTQLQGTYFVLWRRINGTWKEQAVVFAPELCKGGSYCRPNEPRVYHEAPEDVLRKYAGWFQMSDGSVLEIRREGPYLVAQGRPLGHRILIPKSNDEFHTYTPRQDWQPVVARFRSSSERPYVSVELSEGGKRVLAGWKLMSSGLATAQPRPSQDDSPKSAGENLSMLGQASQSELEDLYRRIDLAIVKRDRAALEPLLHENFTFIHANGALDSGPIFLSRVATGIAMMRQQHEDYKEFDPAWTNYGDRTAVRRSRVRIRTKQKNEYWMLQTRVFVKTDRWRMATSHSTRVHDGPIVDAETYRRIAGSYFPESGLPLVLTWHGGGILARWPDTGTTTQIFPVNETEFEDAYRRLKFTIGPDGQPTTVLGFSGQTEILKAARRE